MANIKKGTQWVRIRSRNHTADSLRRKVPTGGKNVIFRLGSQTPTDLITTKKVDIEINTPEACKTSGNKITMKECFDRAEVPTAEWAVMSADLEWDIFPAIIKHVHSSKGNGIYFIESLEDLTQFIENNRNSLSRHIIEKYYTFSREYRLHITKDGCFYACRKMLKRDADARWHRHDNNSVWILEDNEFFNKPDNWDDLVSDCIKAMEAVGLDICAIDVKMQGSDHNTPRYIILETNSAPSLGDVGIQKYINTLTKIVEEV